MIARSIGRMPTASTVCRGTRYEGRRGPSASSSCGTPSGGRSLPRWKTWTRADVLFSSCSCCAYRAVGVMPKLFFIDRVTPGRRVVLELGQRDVDVAIDVRVVEEVGGVQAAAAGDLDLGVARPLAEVARVLVLHLRLEGGQGLEVPARPLDVLLQRRQLVGPLQEPDAPGPGPVEQGGGGQDHVGVDVVGSAGGQPDRLLADVAGQVHLDGDGLAGDELAEAAELVGHGPEPAENVVRVVGPAAGDAHRRRRVLGMVEQPAGAEEAEGRRPGKGRGAMQELSAVQVVPHGGSPSARSGKVGPGAFEGRDLFSPPASGCPARRAPAQPPVGRRGDASMLPRAVLQWAMQTGAGNAESRIDLGVSDLMRWRLLLVNLGECDRSRRQLGNGNNVGA